MPQTFPTPYGGPFELTVTRARDPYEGRMFEALQPVLIEHDEDGDAIAYHVLAWDWCRCEADWGLGPVTVTAESDHLSAN